MKTANELVILGAGGFAAEVIEAAELAGWTISRLYDDDVSAHGRLVLGKSCVGSMADFEQQAPSCYVFAIGNNKVRQNLAARLSAVGHDARAVIHPSAVVSPTASIGAGAYIGAGAFVGPLVKVGLHAIVNVGVSIGHNAVIGDCAQLCPGVRVSGFVRMGSGVFVGSNAVIAPGVVMGEWAKLGASSFAAKDVPAGKLAVGVPARVAD
jgi:sugar O-acyltransferase (sialic acid O-acetyltransferase NeuD family)